MSDWLTTILIFLPMAGALVVWLLPLSKQAAGSLAALVSLAEVAVWILVLERFDFGSGELQFAQQTSWFSEINSSYHVGLYAFSVWLVGLTAVCGAAAAIYAWWVGRERPRAYFGLLLFLTGSVVGVFASQDLLLFYAFFEAMLIPLYVLIGFWGGAGRLRATITFVVYTVAGSLLMLGGDHRVRAAAGHVRPDADGDEHERLALPRLRDRVRGQGAALAVPRLAAGRLPRVAARGGGPALGRDLEGRRVRLHPDRDRQVPRPNGALSRPDSGACGRWARLRLAPRLPGARRARRRRVLVARADGADHVRHLRGQRPRPRRRRAADGQPRAALDVDVPARRDGRAADGDRRALAARRHGARATRARDDPDDGRRDGARRAALVELRRRVPDPRRRLPDRAGAGPSSARSRSCSPRCTCCG